MAPYFFTFGLAALFMLNPIKLSKNLERLVWISVIIYGTLFIGLREEVGGDWLNYWNAYEKLSKLPLSHWADVSRFDPGYLLIGLISTFFNGGIMGVNLICGFIVMTSLVYYARQQPLPWVVIVAAIPFYIIGINMGTVRQGLAISMVLVALTEINKSSLKYFYWITLAILFHKSAVIMLGLLFFKSRNIYLLTFAALFTLGALFLISRLETFEIILLSYVVDPDYESGGATIRVLVSLLPFIGSLIYLREMQIRFSDNWVYLLIGLGTVLLLILSSSLSTLVDRLAYYTVPLQLAFWSRIIAVQAHPIMKAYFSISFVLGYLLMLYIWLAYANHSWAWLPYRIFWPGVDEVTPQTLCLAHQMC